MTVLGALARLIPLRPTAELRAASRVALEAERRAVERQHVIDAQARLLAEANERIARQGRILAAEIRDHQKALGLLVEAEGARERAVDVMQDAVDKYAEAVGRITALDGEAQRLHDELRAAKAKRRKR